MIASTTIPSVVSKSVSLDYTKQLSTMYNCTVNSDGYVVDSPWLCQYSDSYGAVDIGEDMVAVWSLDSSCNTLVMLSLSGYLYKRQEGVVTQVDNNRIVGYCCGQVFDFGGPLLVISTTNGGYIYDGTTLTQIDMPQCYSLVYHYGRLYGYNGSTIYYCKSLDATVWSYSIYDGGYIELPSSTGKCNTIISRGKYLYLMCDGGAYQLTAKTDPLEFALVKLDANIPHVEQGSAVLCGENIWFVSDNIVYSIDSTDVDVMVELPSDINYNYDSDVVAHYYQGCYLLSITTVHSDNLTIGCEKGSCINNTLIIIDTNTNGYTIVRGVDACFIAHLDQLVLCVNGSSYLYKLADRACSRYWSSQQLTLSGHTHKRIDSVIVDTLYPVTLQVTSGKDTRRFMVGRGYHRVAVRMRGNMFGIALLSQTHHMQVKPLCVCYTAFGTDKIGG